MQAALNDAKTHLFGLPMPVATAPRDLEYVREKSGRRVQTSAGLTAGEANTYLSTRWSVKWLGLDKVERTFLFSSNRPLGVSTIMDGGRNGYSEGSKIRQ